MPSVTGIDNDTPPNGFGVSGSSASPVGRGVEGFADGGQGIGVQGQGTVAGVFGSGVNAGVQGQSAAGVGVRGESTNSNGLLGISRSSAAAAVSAVNDSGGLGVFSRGTPAGHFEGAVEITDITTTVLTILGTPGNFSQIIIEPDAPTISIVGGGLEGQTLEIGSSGIGSGRQITINSSVQVTGFAQFQNGKQGFLVDEFMNGSETVLQRGDLLTLQRTEAKEKIGERIPIPHVELSSEAYGVGVCGVVEGAVPKSEHGYQDAISPEVAPGARGLMVTIGCYAECKVDADAAPIEVGDLLTTSSTPGHAQKVLDRSRAVGAIVGKALKAVARGRATIPILVLLH